MATVNASTIDAALEGLGDRTAWLKRVVDDLSETASATLSVSGAVAYSAPNMVIDTYAAASTDILESITGGTPGQLLVVSTADNARDLIIDHNEGTGAILTYTNGRVILDSTGARALFVCRAAGQWSLLAAATGRTSTATIASGVITVSTPSMTIDTEGAAATDDLTDIDGGVAGQTLLLGTTNDGRDVVIKHSVSAGKIRTYSGADVTLGTTGARAFLVCTAADNWSLLSYCP